MILNMVSGGGSGGLNFSVTSYASESSLPTTASENDIAIITSTAITSWIMSATAPTSPTSGMVWMLTGTSSPVAFNMLTENAVQVYPVKASQYISGSWVSKDAKSYKNGAWVTWFNGLFYDNGNQQTSLTGGWKGTGWTYYNSSVNAATISSTYMQITATSMYCMVGTANKINVDNISKMYANIQITTVGSVFFGLTSSTNIGDVVIETQANTVQSYTLELDVSSLTGSYYIYFAAAQTGGYNTSAKITKVWGVT